MPVNLSINNASDDAVRRLRQRAERHHRSLQGGLMAIIKAAVETDRAMMPFDVLAKVLRLGLNTPAEAEAIVRSDRNGC